MLPTVFALCISAMPMNASHHRPAQHGCDNNLGPYLNYADCTRAGEHQVGLMRRAGNGMGQYYCLSVPSEE